MASAENHRVQNAKACDPLWNPERISVSELPRPGHDNLMVECVAVYGEQSPCLSTS